MKKFTCHYCHEDWYVNDEAEEKVAACPFCRKALFKSEEIIVTSFETAILKIITVAGLEILNDAQRFFAYFGDLASSFQKEMRILTRSCDDRVLSKIYRIAKSAPDEAGTQMQRIEKYLVEEEALSEVWAKRICEAFFAAIFPGELPYNVEQVEKIKDITDALAIPAVVQEKTIAAVDYPDIIFSFEQAFVNQIKSTFKGVTKYCSVNQNDINNYHTICLPEDVSILFVNNVRRLPEKTFVNCKGLSVVCFSAKVVDIAKEAFVGCDNLEYVLLLDDNKQLTIYDRSLTSSDKKIYCSVKNHHLRSKYCWFKCYDYGSNAEKSDINKLINFSRIL